MTLLPDSNDMAMLGNLPDTETPTGLPENTGLDMDFQFPDGQEQPAALDAARAPQAPAAQPDIQREILDTLHAIRQPQGQPQQQYQQPPAWVDPAQRPENVARASDLLSRVSYDEEAAGQYNTLQAQWQQERMGYELDQRFAAMQQHQAMVMQAPSIQSQAFNQVQPQYGQGLTRETFDAVLSEIFPDPAQMSALLNPALNPNAGQIAAMVADTAYGRSMRMNPAQPPARAPLPANVRSDARNPSPGRANNDVWQDNSYVDNIIDQAMHNPFAFNRGGNQ